MAARRAAIPVKRTTSRHMFRGSHGWIGGFGGFPGSKPTDLVFWTFKSSRPHGHVGALILDPDHVTHASGGRGRVVVDKFNKYLRGKCSGIKRLTIGDNDGK